ncbi:MAG: UDP-2,3-diacylglucosamine diphosphatase [Gammaproteobacteria bacterium]|nr:UDP-2,3-diacylglucosamine diphosphatase [Gammaproteobacteria bacterium]
MTVAFISDLHLCADRPAMTALLRAFLQCRLNPGDTLYILGDLFEAWLGDDAVLPDQRPVLESLHATAGRGVTLFFMHGNRDFLAGAGFAAESGCSLLADPAVIELGGERALLMHGDTLCTDDLGYQSYRSRVRSPDFRAHVLSLPLDERIALAGHYRSESARLSRDKPPEIMDVNQGAVETAMRAHGVRRLIHGHTHRQAAHEFTLDGAPAQRIVLGDWYRNGCALEYTHGRYLMSNFGLDSLGAPPARAATDHQP